MDLKSKIRIINDFPKPGISFKDITTLLKDGEGYREMSDGLIEIAKTFDFDLVASPEARGFIAGAPVAYALKKGFIPVRKPGKLPAPAITQPYGLEYGANEVQIHIDSVKKGQKVLIIDDLLATGGTAMAAAKLVESLGGVVVGFIFVSELTALDGRDLLKDYTVKTLIQYDDAE